tara:strand:- start:361 stop:921 length:561 start_codon:yes stop_codon:yes gene_type:complete
MRNLTATICLAVALLLGSAGVSWSQDWQKGWTAYKSGDYATALREWTPLAERGHTIAQNKLGLMYRKGQGVPQDDKTAVKWWTLAAEQGNASAQTNLGAVYANGQGVPQNYKTAAKWWTLAAEQGDTDAQSNLKKIKARLVSKGIDECLYKEVAKITGPESKKIVEKYCRKKLEKKSLDWLLRYAD